MWISIIPYSHVAFQVSPVSPGVTPVVASDVALDVVDAVTDIVTFDSACDVIFSLNGTKMATSLIKIAQG